MTQKLKDFFGCYQIDLEFQDYILLDLWNTFLSDYPPWNERQVYLWATAAVAICIDLYVCMYIYILYLLHTLKYCVYIYVCVN